MGNSTCGVRVVFDLAIDEGAWPGAIADRAAGFGQLWVGPMGFLAFLETALGLGGKFLSSVERAHAMAALLETRHGFWRSSFETDAIATSERLLADRDLLVMHAWQGEDISPRLTELWHATLGAEVGTADRLRAVLEALSRQHVDVESVQLYQERASLPPLWDLVLDALDLQHVAVEVLAIARPAQSGDLEAAQSVGFTPSGDGRLVLLRPHGQLAAAETVAASLAQMESLEDVVVIGGDSMLDEALGRHGLPRLGLASSPPASHALVQLVLESAFAPMDPASLHALLCLDPGPVPRNVARRLCRAIGSLPGRKGPDWTRELRTGLEELADDRRDKVARRITDLVMPMTTRDLGLPLAALDARLHALSSWAHGRLQRYPELAGLTGHCQRLAALATQCGDDNFELPEVLRLCAQTAGGGGRMDAQAGLSGIRNPAALLGPARVVIWWDFTRASAPRARRIRLTDAERGAMRDAGIRPPDPSREMSFIASHWQRPLRLAMDALILVSPEVDETGGASYPHPLWDELSSSMSESQLASGLISARLSRPALAVSERCSRLRLPEANSKVRTTARLALREFESPSSFKGLLGCSLRWALTYGAKLYPGIASGPGEPSPLLYGTVAHYLLAEVFKGGALDEQQAASSATELVDRDLTNLCEALGLPRYRDELAIVRRAIIESARQLGLIMRESGAKVRGVELEVERDFGGFAIKGRADMILSEPDVIIDLKWGPSTNRKSLKSGTSLQLAAYAHIEEQRGSLPSVAYFILRDQLLLAEPDTPLQDASIPGTIKSTATWQAALSSLATRRAQLANGELYAPGAMGDDVESALVGDAIAMNPECGYCDYAALCGRGAGQ